MLKPLAPEVRQCLRSGVAIASYAQAAEELIHNAVDAGASCVAIRVDLNRKKLQVVDNGCGVNRDGLEIIAERYNTSKCTSVEDLETQLQHYGYRGEALASIRNMCYLLDIESRAKGSTSTYTKLFKEGVSEGIKEARAQRPSAGTTISVYDLFSRLPVRNKAMRAALELERIKKHVEAVSLIHPKISFSLRDEESGSKLLQTHKSNSVLGAFTHLFGSTKSRPLCEVSAFNEEDKLSVNGYIGKDGHSNKHLQFVYVNGRLVLKTKIHKLVNHCMAKTTVLRKKGFDPATKWSPGNTTEDVGANRHTERHPVYVIHVRCPLNTYDITFDPRKTLVEFKDWEVVIKCVETAVREFIERENLASSGERIDRDSPGMRAIFSAPGMAVDSQDSQENDGNPAEVKEGKAEDSCEENTTNHGETFGEINFYSSVYGSSITTSDMTNVLQSKVVKLRVSRGDEAQCVTSESVTSKLQTPNGDGQCDVTDHKADYGSGAVCTESGDHEIVNLCKEKPDGRLQGEAISEVNGKDRLENVEEKRIDPEAAAVEVHSPDSSSDSSPPDLEFASDTPYSGGHDSPPHLVPVTPTEEITCPDTPQEGVGSVSTVPSIRMDHDTLETDTDSPSNFNSNHVTKRLKRIMTQSNSNNKPEDSCFLSHSNVTESSNKDNVCHKSHISQSRSFHVKRLQNMKVQIKEKGANKLQSLNTKHVGLRLTPLKKLRRQVLEQKLGNKMMTPERQKQVAAVSSRQRSHARFLSPLLKLRRKYENLQSNIRARNVSENDSKICEQPKDTDLLLLDDQMASTSWPSDADNQIPHLSCPQNSPVSSDRCELMDEDPLAALSSPATARKSVQVTVVVEGGDTIENQCVEDAGRPGVDLNPSVSACKSLLSPLQRIRERLLAKTQVRRRDNEARKEPDDPCIFSSCKKHADVSKHKNSPWQKKVSDLTETQNLRKPEDCMNGHGDAHVGQNLRKEGDVFQNAFKHSCKRELFQCEKSAILGEPTKQSEQGSSEKRHKGMVSGNVGDCLQDEGYLPEKFIQKCTQFQQKYKSDMHAPEASKKPITCLDLANALKSIDNNVSDTSMQGYCGTVFGELSSLHVPQNITNSKHKDHIRHEDTSKETLGQQPKSKYFLTSEDFLQSADKFDFPKALQALDTSMSAKALQSPKKEDSLNQEVLNLEGLSSELPEMSGVDQGNAITYDANSVSYNTSMKDFVVSEFYEITKKTTQECRLYDVENIETEGDKATAFAFINENSSNLQTTALIKAEHVTNVCEDQHLSENNSPEIDNGVSMFMENTQSDLETEITNLNFTKRQTEINKNTAVTINQENKLSQEFGDFTQAFDNVLSESQGTDCDSNSDNCDGENLSNTLNNHEADIAFSADCDSCSDRVGTQEGSGDVNTTTRSPQKEGHSSSHKSIVTSSILSKVVSNPQGKRRSFLLPVTAEAFLGSASVRCQPKTSTEVVDSVTNKFYIPSAVDNITGRVSNSVEGCGNNDLGIQETGSGEEEFLIKWRGGEVAEPEQPSVTQLLKAWENPMFEVSSTPAVNAEVGDASLQRILALSHPVNFTKDMLNNVKVLNQIDNKFIACLMKSTTEELAGWDLLVVVDQHAAHERVRLEKFTQDLYLDVESRRLRTSPVHPALQVTTTESTVRVMEAYTHYFSRIGLCFTVVERGVVSVHSVPACFVQERGEEERGPSKPPDTAFLLRQIQLLIREQVDVLEKTHGANVTLPKIIHQVLCARACHGAIKFGDALSVAECEDLIGCLRGCLLPFQCAHGRPSVMPILNLTQITPRAQVISRPHLSRLRERKSTDN